MKPKPPRPLPVRSWEAYLAEEAQNDARFDRRFTAVMVAMILAGVVAVGYAFATRRTGPRPCSDFADWPAGEVPIRCTRCAR